MNIESIKDIMDAFDPASLLPDLTSVAGTIAFISRLCVLAGPIVVLLLGLGYFFIAPKEANHYFGYRCIFGMGSVEAWRFTQRLAGMVFGGLGLVLTLIWECVLIAGGCVGINVITALRFDYKGNFRKKKG